MTEIRPLKAWRYNKHITKNIEQLVSPLFDVVSPAQRMKLYKNEYNSIHLSVPQGNNPAANASLTLKKWIKDGIIVQDSIPSIYVYYQYFSLPGYNNEFCRKGFIANFKMNITGEDNLLRHENTMFHSVKKQLNILDKTQLNVSPTHGLYTDFEMEIETYLDEAIHARQLYQTENYQGVRDVLGVIDDESTIAHIVKCMTNKQVILADGHHRYDSSLQYAQKQAKENINHQGNEGYNYLLMYFTNTAFDNIKILPTHRLIYGLPDFSEEKLINNLKKYFIVKPVAEFYDILEIIQGKKHHFGLLLRNCAYILSLKSNYVSEISWDLPLMLKKLDIIVIHYYFIEKCLGIKQANQRTSPCLSFERNFTKCVQTVEKQKAQCAIITQHITMETIAKVCKSGYKLPQKSTYFYPKVVSGLLFRSLKDTSIPIKYDT